MTYQFMKVNGTNIHYEERGTGTAVIFIHAGIANLNMWDEQVDTFAERYRVIRYDLRGWGETANPPMAYSDCEDLHGLLKGLGVEKGVLIGYSFGRKTAIDFTLQYPHMVEKLVLVGAALGGYKYSDEGISDKDQAVDAAYDRGDLDEAVELTAQIWFDGPSRLPEQSNSAARAKIVEMIMHTYRLSEDEGKRQELNPPANERLADLKMPTLLIVGEHDCVDMHVIASRMSSHLPSSEQILMRGTAHIPNMEKPGVFNRHVLDFMTQ